MNYQKNFDIKVSTKGLTKDFINGYKILNGARYIISGIFQNYLILVHLKNKLNIFMALLKFIHGNLMECLKRVLKIQLNQTAFLHQLLLIIILPDIYFNGHCLINNISIPKKVINTYISYIINQEI